MSGVLILSVAAGVLAVQASAFPTAAPAATGAGDVTHVARLADGAPSPGPEANFTGQVRVRNPVRVPGGSRVRGASVSFAPGARTAWHSHPQGQMLVVTEGCGWTQVRGGRVEQICAGDVAWVDPGGFHWHGATPTSAMTHVAISETAEGESVQWLQKVTDAEYRLTAEEKP